jgi:photosystem II stability/assembly factor-like uncharacterized protein
MAIMAMLLLGFGSAARAHDPSTYGGLFRSHNLGGTWLNADVGLFLNAALTVAIDPRDSDHLLLGTDTGVLGSHNGGRSWVTEGGGAIVGPVFAIAFSPAGDGSAICIAPGGVFRFHENRWTHAAASREAGPARAAIYVTPERIYLLGHGGLYLSDDGGESFRQAPHPPTAGTEISALAVAGETGSTLLALAGGELLASEHDSATWRQRNPGDRGASVDTAARDPSSPSRLWAASADRIFLSDDLGDHWRAVGKPLPERQTNVRGIAADPMASTIVVTTHRGLYRSVDGGFTWVLMEGNLPVHLEAGPLARDPRDPETIYAVYSLMPYAVVWATALEGGSLMSRVDAVSIASGVSFLLLLLLSGVLLVRWLARRRGAAPYRRDAVS